MQPATFPLLLGSVLLAAVAVAVLVSFLMRRRLDAEIVAAREVSAELAAVREAKASLDGQLAVERLRTSRLLELEQTLLQQAKLYEGLRAAKADADRMCATATEALSRVEAALRDAQARLTEAEDRLATVRTEREDLKTDLATMQERLNKERLHAAENLRLLQDAKETMTKEFRLLADDVMARHGESFSKQNKEQMDGLLLPLREKLTEFQQGLQTAHTQSATERATLGEQIRSLSEANAKMTTETTNLTRALKGKAQTQGAWGEMILGTILQRSGLREGAEYDSQASHTAEDGRRLRPDVIVHLPGERRVVIDAKVSLVAFEGHVNAETDHEREACLGRHVESVRTHIRTLGSKEYQSSTGTGLNYVVMFVPIEGAVAAALQFDPEITSFADQCNVAILTPTTLMIALRTVESVWQSERRNRNAEEIAGHAGRLYGKFVGFVEDMKALGDRLTQAQDAYQGAMGKLSTGRGNLVRRVEELKKMGAKTGKALPPTLLGDDGEEPSTIIEAVAGFEEVSETEVG